MNELLHDVDVVGVRGDPSAIDVHSIELDSRRVERGALFCCVRGEHTDGHRYAPDAVARGAVALFCEEPLDLGITEVVVGDGGVRPAMASASAAFFGHPADALATVGVTGTNGKTTVTHMVATILETAGLRCGVLGTLGGARTTPESPVLQAELAALRDGGHRAVALEVSSHALTQHRVDAMVFDVAAFTNLSREHLDHHGTMDAYFEAKAALFEPSRARRAVVNVDDPWGRRLADRIRGIDLVEVDRSGAAPIELALGGSSFTWRGERVRIPISGGFNVDNALLAAAVAGSLGVGDDAVVTGLGALRPVPGRMEVVTAGPPFAILVDYAHTPDGLETALGAARRLAEGRVVCLFGCGGDRDAGKRPEMGAVAERLADVSVLTSDNPRSEDPITIIEQVRAGMGADAIVVVEPDRRAAIETAVGLAGPGDVVLLAGKGHETTQTAAGVERPFDDREEARRALAARVGGAPR